MTEQTADKLTILVVDDSRLMRLAARKILKEDFEVLEAADGEQAWEALQANPQVSLVMSDLSMPNLDGLGLLRRIREADQPTMKTLPVIIVTGAEDDDGSKQTALGAGASDFITKPFESVQLLARTKAQAKQQQTQQALQDSEASKQQLEQRSNVDALTGLPNQREFANQVEAGLSYALRHRTELSLLLVQVDKYKVMFLRRGKQSAEAVLKRLGQLLNAGRRREDCVARVGLDTFGVLLPSANRIGAQRVAEQLLDAVHNEDFSVDGESIPVSVSIAATSPAISHGVTTETLLQDAQDKLGAAASAGGDRLQSDSDGEHTATEAAQPTPPPAPAVASALEVQEALQALAAGARPGTDSEALARAVLPLLQAWDQAHENRYAALIATIESALTPPQEAALAVPADAF